MQEESQADIHEIQSDRDLGRIINTGISPRTKEVAP